MLSVFCMYRYQYSFYYYEKSDNKEKASVFCFSKFLSEFQVMFLTWLESPFFFWSYTENFWLIEYGKQWQWLQLSLFHI